MRIRIPLCVALVMAVAPLAVRADVIVIGASKDNTLYEDKSGSRSNGSGSYVFAGRTSNNQLRRALLTFDIEGSLPQNVTIDAVTLTLFMYRTP